MAPASLLGKSMYMSINRYNLRCVQVHRGGFDKALLMPNKSNRHKVDLLCVDNKFVLYWAQYILLGGVNPTIPKPSFIYQWDNNMLLTQNGMSLLLGGVQFYIVGPVSPFFI